MRAAFRSLIGVSLAIGVGIAGSAYSPAASAAGDGATRFNVYVPPNNVNNRDSYLIVTNVAPQVAAVNIVDDDADGDSDDSASTSLAQGESYLVRLKDGAVNDDVGGKRDGDYFKITSDHPIVVQMATRSNWQHDWVPSEGKGGRGTSFFVYAPASSGADNDANVFAYEDNTKVTITDITAASSTSTGKTSVSLEDGTPVLSQVLNQGEDLVVRNNQLGLDILDPGHTYWVQASKPVTMQYGHLGQVRGGNQARDGAGFVPSANGSTTGSLYYFSIPHNPGRESEKELRVSCFDEATVSVYGASATDTSWSLLTSDLITAGGHLDLTGQAHSGFRNSGIYKLTVDPPHHRCTVFEGNWMETGSFGTSDFASAVSASNGQNLGHVFQAYVGPPGKQENVAYPTGELTNISHPHRGFASHLYIYAMSDDTQVTVTDVDTEGGHFSETFSLDADQYYDTVIEKSMYLGITNAGDRPYFRVAASKPVMVMNGNFNDNWMAYFHSVSVAEPAASVVVSSETLGCSQTATIEVSCENTGALASVEVTPTVTLPEMLSLTSVPEGASVNGRNVALSSAVLTAGESTNTTLSVQMNCEESVCLARDLSAITLECHGVSGGEVYSTLATQQMGLSASGEAQVTDFFVQDVPDYESASPSPRVLVNFTVDAPAAGTVKLYRAVNSPDPGASQTLLTTINVDAGVSTLSYTDNYSLHYESTRFYRLKTTVAGCEVTDGPQAVKTSSGMSSGFDSGLESNGSLSHQLARRAILRTDNPVAIESRVLDLLPPTYGILSKMGGSELSALEKMMPQFGPSDSAPVNVTPGDLPALTNALEVVAVDYLDGEGGMVASLLGVKTQGETYEHSKALCDRAGGSAVDWVEASPLPEGELLRFASRNSKRSEGEYSVPFKLYEEADGTFSVHSGWLAEDFPEVSENQNVYNFQAWSAKPGLALSLAEEVMGGVDASAPTLHGLPESYFMQAGTLAGGFGVEIGGEQPQRLRRTFLMEDGTNVTDVVEWGDAEMWTTDFRFLDVTLELLGSDDDVMDRVWMSDGAWAVMDDSMLGGTTQLDAKFSCPKQRPYPQDELAFAGCATVSGEVADYGGVARHFGGVQAPLRLEDMQSLVVEVVANEAIDVCLHEGEERYCTSIEAPSGLHRLPLEGFYSESCEPAPLDQIGLVSLVSAQAGYLEMTASDLRFSGTAPDGPATPCTLDVANEEGCGCSTPGRVASSGHHLLLLAGALGLFWWRRRRSVA